MAISHYLIEAESPHSLHVLRHTEPLHMSSNAIIVALHSWH